MYCRTGHMNMLGEKQTISDSNLNVKLTNYGPV